jgi:hypothetical protein
VRPRRGDKAVSPRGADVGVGRGGEGLAVGADNSKRGCSAQVSIRKMMCDRYDGWKGCIGKGFG